MRSLAVWLFMLISFASAGHADEQAEMQSKCAAEWKAAQAAGTLEPEARWPAFWSKCNIRLKAAGGINATRANEPTVAATTIKLDEVATKVRRSGLLGEWSSNNCAANAAKTIYSVDKSGSALQTTVQANGKRGSSRFVAFEAINVSTFKATTVQQDASPPITTYLTFSLEGNRLRHLDTRDAKGLIIVENGLWAIGNKTPVEAKVRCNGSSQVAGSANIKAKQSSPSVQTREADPLRFVTNIHFDPESCRSPSGVSIMADVRPSDAHIFLNDEELLPILRALWARLHATCLEVVRVRGVPVGTSLGPNGTYKRVSLSLQNADPTISGIAIMQSEDGVHFSGDNQARQGLLRLQDTQRQIQQANLQAQRAIQAGQELRTKVQASVGYQQFVLPKDFSANPFRYNGIIGMEVRFTRMLSSSEAIFQDISGVEVYASGVPSTLFAGGELVILGVRANGTKAIKTPGGEVTLASGEYVGFYRCGCENFYR